MRWIPITALGLTLINCGGGSPLSTQNTALNWRDIGAKCATPRSGTDPVSKQPYPDKQGTLNDEKTWLRAWINDTYLWYKEVPAVDPAQYSSAIAYFDQLRTTQKTPSGNDKDRFHFWYTTAEWEALSTSGIEVGYGITYAALSRSPPRVYVVAYVEPGSPADGKLSRGMQIKAVDGADLVNGNTQAIIDTLNAGLFPAASGEVHTFTVVDVNGMQLPDVQLTSASVASDPVPDAHVIAAGTANIGYLLFNDHVATAEQRLIDQITTLKNQNITDLVLDIRYNGGGYLAIASEIAYMIAGAGRTSGKTFEQLQFNDKYPSKDPITGQNITPTPFFTQALGFSAQSGTALPTLNLPRVFVLTGPGTCSASESILNSLDGVGVQVIEIGATTCGKPYGFYPEDNCGTTYFAIQFRGVNAKGFGDYADGFVPAATAPVAGFPGCQIADDFTKALGNPGENRLEAAINYATTGSCGTPVAAGALRAASGLHGDGEVLKSAWRQNRILGLPRRP